MEMELPISRIQLFAKVNSLSIKKFEATCEIKPNVLQNAITRKSSISIDTLGKIKSAFPDLSLNWVIFGKGEMLLSKSNAINDKINQEPDYAEFLQIIQRIEDNELLMPLKEKLFQLYQSNSALKSELLRVYQLIGDI